MQCPGCISSKEKPIRGKDSETQVFNTRRNKIHHFLSPVRISALGVNFLDMPAPVDDEMIDRDMYAPARHACPLSYSGRRIEERSGHKGEGRHKSNKPQSAACPSLVVTRTPLINDSLGCVSSVYPSKFQLVACPWDTRTVVRVK